MQAEEAKRRTDVYFIAELLDRFKLLAQSTHAATIDRFNTEKDRLMTVAKALPPASQERAMVNEAAKFNVQNVMETEVATLELLEFYWTTKSMLGSKALAPECRFLACGDHATCRPASEGKVHCVCDPCYMGNGFSCRRVQCSPGSIGSAQPVRGPMPVGYPTVRRQAPGNVVELQMATFEKDLVAVVLRDAADGNRGSLIIGRIEGVEVKWGFRQFLSASPAFGTVVKGFPSGRLVLGFRDKEQEGVSYLIGGQVNVNSLQATLTAPRMLATDQTQHMVLVPMATFRVVCLYAAQALDGEGVVTRAWGSAALLEVLEFGNLRKLGTFHFSEGSPVARISAVPLSPTSLVVGYRAVPPKGMGQPEEASRELSALWIGMEEDELVVDPHPIAIESDHGAMWARDVALVAQNTFAYSYESVHEKLVKMAVVRVDPVTHRMTITGGPQIISKGSTEYLHSVSLPLYPGIPSTLTVFQRPKESCMFELCRVSPEGRVADCRQKTWADQELRAVSGGRLQDGRLLFAMVDTKGTLLSQILTHEDLQSKV